MKKLIILSLVLSFILPPDAYAKVYTLRDLLSPQEQAEYAKNHKIQVDAVNEIRQLATSKDANDTDKATAVFAESLLLPGLDEPLDPQPSLWCHLLMQAEKILFFVPRMIGKLFQ